MAKRDTTETAKDTGSAGRYVRAATDQYGCRPAGRSLFPWDILVLGNRHRRYLASVHSDGSGASAALSWVHQRKTGPGSAHIRFLQYGLSPLLSDLVVLARVLLVVENPLVYHAIGLLPVFGPETALSAMIAPDFQQVDIMCLHAAPIADTTG